MLVVYLDLSTAESSRLDKIPTIPPALCTIKGVELTRFAGDVSIVDLRLCGPHADVQQRPYRRAQTLRSPICGAEVAYVRA